MPIAQETPGPRIINRATNTVAVAQAALGAAKWARSRWEASRTWRVSVRQDDRLLYSDVHAWVVGEMPASDRRALVARVDDSHDDSPQPDTTGISAPASLALYYDESRSTGMILEGHRVEVSVTIGEKAKSGDGRWSDPDVITFACRSEAAQQAVVRQLGVIAARRRGIRPPALYLMTSWGSWNRVVLPARPWASVVLAAGQAQRIDDDLRRFLADEGRYVARGIPWHRGYLLHGPPGTGKTSLARALAGRHGLDVYYVPLADVSSDGSLMGLVSEVRARSMLLIEDVDVYRQARERPADGSRTSTMAGLLNALDGVATPHGLVVVLTSNHPDALDPALLRPGRVDVAEELSAPDAEQAGRLFEAFYGCAPPGEIDPAGQTSADLVETWKRHWDDPRVGYAASPRMALPDLMRRAGG